MTGKGIPLAGDRAVWNALEYPSLHTNDADTLGGLHQTTRLFIFTIESFLVVGNKPLRYYNIFGRSFQFVEAFLGVDGNPIGADILVDLHKNGTTIWTNQGNRPRIIAGAYTGFTITFDVTTWADGEYLQIGVDQVGSSSAGRDLTVQLLVK